MSWVPPTFAEIDMSAEIGSYQEDFEPPAERDFVFTTPKADVSPPVDGKRAEE